MNNSSIESAVGLYTFLRELTELRSKTVRTIDNYESVLWLSDIPEEKECYSAVSSNVIEGEREEIWVEISKPILKNCPVPPDALDPWLKKSDLNNSQLQEPEPQEEIVVSNPEDPNQTDVLRLDDHPHILDLWEKYIDEKWRPWAKEDLRLKRVQEVYAKVFSLYQQQQRLGEQYEVIVGLGFLTWKMPETQVVHRHLLSAQTNVTFNANNGRITVGPAAGGAKLTLEQDMIDPQFRPESYESKCIEEEIEQIGDQIWDKVRVGTSLGGWVNSVDAKGQYNDTIIRQAQFGENPLVHLAPALILRKRTERSFVKAFEKIIGQLERGEAIPEGVRLMVSPSDTVSIEGERTIPDFVTGQAVEDPQEVYFPLNANNEQLQIVKRLSANQGVLVQGPPGTGKSHTIVNLICHLLATGQKVLVTSHTARALQVLQHFISEKVEEVAPLAVVLLGDDRESLQHMEDSVQGITTKFGNWDPNQNRSEINQLEKELDQHRKEEARIHQKQTAIRERDTYEHPHRSGGYQGTTQVIAARLKEEQGLYDWLKDRPKEGKEQTLTDLEAVELLQLLRDVNLDRIESEDWRTLPPDFFPVSAEFEDLVSNEKAAHEASNGQAAIREHAAHEPLLASPKELQTKLGQQLDLIIKSYMAVTQNIQSWTEQAAKEVLAEQDRPWRDLLEVTHRLLQTLKERAHWMDETSITGIEGKDPTIVLGDAKGLYEHLNDGGRLGFGFLRATPVKRALYIIEEVRVKGRVCDAVGPLKDLIDWLELSEQLRRLNNSWINHTHVPSSSFSGQVAYFSDLCEPLEEALSLKEIKKQIEETLGQIVGLQEPSWHVIDEIQKIYKVILAIQLEENAQQASERINAIEYRMQKEIESIKENVDPVATSLLQSISSRNLISYKQDRDNLSDNYHLQQQLDRRRVLLEALKSMAPELAQSLVQNPSDSVWDDRLKCFIAAWNWGKTTAWLEIQADPKALEGLNHQMEACRLRIKKTLSKIAAARAWDHCFRRMTPHEERHLKNWSHAVRRIGRGTGKRAHKHRQAAQEHMEQCRTAIPAWIMPIYRVAESIQPEKDLFDVVIIDEASQSGPEALLLLYLAKKIVVVGDDKQISPDNVGLNRNNVDELRMRYLSNFQHGDAFGTDNSFFDLADIHYSNRVRLREHFRCMPEIIQFSNNLCYANEPLIPLRQYGAQRIEPVVGTNHVEDGYIKGSGSRIVNPPEAEEIVKRIVQYCDDPVYKNKTIGVISLQGAYQARHIESLLIEALPPNEIAEREIVCGDAYAFQGDERDIIFLSMVAAPPGPGENRRIGNLSNEAARRRFNVAVSRARDQIWLYHTATLNDLSPSCMRHALLKYCSNPDMKQPMADFEGLDKIRHFAATADRSFVNAPDPFDSWFEVDVFLRIQDRGFRVIPQYEVAGYHIDLVVQGMDRSLAIECDGDRWHGPERYQHDMARQRDLERCGWSFWRVRGSRFYIDPDSAMENLWEELERHQVYPEGNEPYRAAPVLQDRYVADKAEEDKLSLAQHNENEKVSLPVTDVEVVKKSETAVIEIHRSTQEILPLDKQDMPLFVHDDDEEEASLPSSVVKDSRPDLVEEKDMIEKVDEAEEEVEEIQDTKQELSLQFVVNNSYEQWNARPLPDLRNSSTKDIVPVLVEIITAEGPMLALRAFQLYVKATGGQRVTNKVRPPLIRALETAIRQGLIEHREEHHENLSPYINHKVAKLNWIVRKSGTPPVKLRPLGDRQFHELPPSEIVTLIRQLQANRLDLVGEPLQRRVIEYYGSRRLGDKSKVWLAHIEDHVKDMCEESSPNR